jgi:hypothetical protein
VPQTVMRHGGDIRPNPASPGKSLRSFRLGGEPVLWEVVYSYVSNFELSPSEGSPRELHAGNRIICQHVAHIMAAARRAVKRL